MNYNNFQAKTLTGVFILHGDRNNPQDPLEGVLIKITAIFVANTTVK